MIWLITDEVTADAEHMAGLAVGTVEVVFTGDDVVCTAVLGQDTVETLACMGGALDVSITLAEDFKSEVQG